MLAAMARVEVHISDAFATVVRSHREKKGLSKAALAELAGLHQTYIGLLERGQRSPNLDTMRAIAKALGIPLAKLIAETERMITEARKD